MCRNSVVLARKPRILHYQQFKPDVTPGGTKEVVWARQKKKKTGTCLTALFEKVSTFSRADLFTPLANFPCGFPSMPSQPVGVAYDF